MHHLATRVLVTLLLLTMSAASYAVPKHASFVSGTVTSTVGGTPIAGAQVVVYVADPLQFIGATTTAANGTYTVTVVEGTFLVFAGAESAVGELYDNVTCLQVLFCDPAGATPVVVAHGATTSGIDFALAPKGRIQGTVVGGSPATPREGVSVSAEGNGGAGGSATTAADGSYSMFVNPGSMRVFTGNSQQLIDEQHDNIPCPLGRCDRTAGTLFTVASGQTITGVNFALATGASIGGEITRASDGQPITDVGVDVALHDAAGTLLTTVIVEPDGTWAVPTGLPSGNYRAVARPFVNYTPEVWDDVACTGPPGDECDVLGGDLIALLAPNVAGNVDFALVRTVATISGTVTQFAGGAPVDAQEIQVVRVSDQQIATAFTAPDGTWSIADLEPGDYQVRVIATPPLLNEQYPNVQCQFGFFFCVGTPQTIVLVAGQDRTGVDFALAPLATIAVGVRNAATAQLIASQLFIALPGRADRVSGTTPAGGTGVIEVPNGGAVRFAATSTTCGAGGNVVCLGERFPNDPCPHFNCDLGTGATVTVAKGASVTGIELALGTGAIVSGTVTAAVGGAPLNGLVQILDTGRVPVSGGFTDSEGDYAVGGLGSGPYYAIVSAASPLIDELYDNVACPNAACVLGSGISLNTVPGATLAGIDFSLSAGGTIAGQVQNDLGSPIVNASVAAFNSAGTQVASTSTDVAGNYVTSGLPAGTYFLRFSKPGFLARLYDAISCPDAACNPTTGTPIGLLGGQNLTGIDAGLPGTGEAGPPQLVYLNRCAGNCTVRSGFESSINDTSSIISGTRVMPAYSFGDASFAALTACVRDVFARYQVTITTTDPGNVPHREHMIGGSPGDLGFSSGVGGVAPYMCGAGIPNSISFTFSEPYGDDIHELCWTATQEIGHQFGLDHEFNPPDSMSYIEFDTKGFTQGIFPCGEHSPRTCDCGNPAGQDTDAHLRGLVGLNPQLFRDGFENPPPSAMAPHWKAYHTELPWLKPAHRPTCGTDTVAVMKAHRERVARGLQK